MMTSAPPTNPDQSTPSAMSQQQAHSTARLGSWQYDPLRRVFSWDARCKEILGVSKDGATVVELMNWVHPDDADRVWVAINALLDPTQPRRYGNEFRVRRGDDD